jgi:hypothetical protein
VPRSPEHRAKLRASLAKGRRLQSLDVAVGKMMRQQFGVVAVRQLVESQRDQ